MMNKKTLQSFDKAFLKSYNFESQTEDCKIFNYKESSIDEVGYIFSVAILTLSKDEKPFVFFEPRVNSHDSVISAFEVNDSDESKVVRGFLTDKGYFLKRDSAAEVYKKFEKNILNKELVNNHYQLYSYNVDWKQVRIKIKNPFING